MSLHNAKDAISVLVSFILWRTRTVLCGAMVLWACCTTSQFAGLGPTGSEPRHPLWRLRLLFKCTESFVEAVEEVGLVIFALWSRVLAFCCEVPLARQPLFPSPLMSGFQVSTNKRISSSSYLPQYLKPQLTVDCLLGSSC